MYDKRACRNLCSAIMLAAKEDYDNNLCQEEIRAFVNSRLFKLYAGLTVWSDTKLRRLIMEKDCKTCENRYKEKVCIRCYQTDPTQTHDFYKKDSREKKKNDRA